MSHKKWRREMEAKDDEHQTTFTKTGALKEHQKTITFTSKALPITEQYMCPFCLAIHPLQKFLISTSKGYHKGMGRCPECNNQMKLTTLTAEWTPEQYAEFIHPYATSGFWQKCKYKVWSERLKKIGWNYRFWKRYRELKGEAEKERETIIDKQEKMRYECPKCGERNEPGTVFCTYCKTRLIESYG